jgi:predicted molibdopterin-dependent oxidoreductase YjgC
MSTQTKSLTLTVNGQTISVAHGTTVAAALAIAGNGISRISVTGQARTPVCGMGVCQECRVWVNGQRRLGCQTLCTSGMEVVTTQNTALGQTP